MTGNYKLSLILVIVAIVVVLLVYAALFHA
jgi:hypothetical protein